MKKIKERWVVSRQVMLSENNGWIGTTDFRTALAAAKSMQRSLSNEEIDTVNKALEILYKERDFI